MSEPQLHADVISQPFDKAAREKKLKERSTIQLRVMQELGYYNPLDDYAKQAEDVVRWSQEAVIDKKTFSALFAELYDDQMERDVSKIVSILKQYPLKH